MSYHFLTPHLNLFAFAIKYYDARVMYFNHKNEQSRNWLSAICTIFYHIKSCISLSLSILNIIGVTGALFESVFTVPFQVVHI